MENTKIKGIVCHLNEQTQASTTVKSIDEYVPQTFEENAISHSVFEKTAKTFLGKVLTVIDASISDKKQNKAIKDIIKNDYVNMIMLMVEHTYNQEEMQKCANKHFENVSDEELEASMVDIQDVMGIKED